MIPGGEKPIRRTAVEFLGRHQQSQLQVRVHVLAHGQAGGGGDQRHILGRDVVVDVDRAGGQDDGIEIIEPLLVSRGILEPKELGCGFVQEFLNNRVAVTRDPDENIEVAFQKCGLGLRESIGFEFRIAFDVNIYRLKQPLGQHI